MSIIITKDILTKIGVSSANNTDQLVSALNDTLTKYQINTHLRISHFLAQTLHESGGFGVFKENLNYSADGLRKVFGKYFTTDDIANEYSRKPESIANRVYADRMGNGNEASGDGWRYRGMGAIQLTGKDNRISLSRALNVDFVGKDSELLYQFPYAIESAGWYWNSRSLNADADKDDIISITKKINGGTNGLDDRKNWLTKCKTIISVN